jgi:molecular chaperone DnaK
MKNEAKANEDADKEVRERVEKLNKADNLIFSSEKQLKEYGDKIPADKKGAIESALEELRAAHKSENIAGIDGAEEKLQAAWMAASEDMYKAGGEPQGEPQAANAGANDGGVADAEYEEVK